MQKLNVPSAQLSSDEDFFRRINLDLTGRIPGSEDVRAFVAESNKDKRDAVIDRLLASPEFTDRWTMWMGDLLAEHCQPCCRSRQPRTPGTQRVLFLH